MRKGFTLIELLVVVLIIAILAAIALPKYELAVEKTRSREAFSVLSQLEIGLRDQYLAQGQEAYKNRPQGQAVFDSLDVSISNLVEGNDKRHICSKFFMYDIDCNPWWGMCQLTAGRYSDNRSTPSSCVGVATYKARYWIEADVYFHSPTVLKCSVSDNDGNRQQSQKFCEMFLEDWLVSSINQ